MDGFRLNNRWSVHISKVTRPECKPEAFPLLVSSWHKLLDFMRAGTLQIK